jgi:hypothetical protein
LASGQQPELFKSHLWKSLPNSPLVCQLEIVHRATHNRERLLELLQNSMPQTPPENIPSTATNFPQPSDEQENGFNGVEARHLNHKKTDNSDGCGSVASSGHPEAASFGQCKTILTPKQSLIQDTAGSNGSTVTSATAIAQRTSALHKSHDLSTSEQWPGNRSADSGSFVGLVRQRSWSASSSAGGVGHPLRGNSLPISPPPSREATAAVVFRTGIESQVDATVAPPATQQ